MVRKQTWILIGVFAVLLAVMFYLQKNPLPAGGTATPSPTAEPLLLNNWKSSDVVALDLKEGQNSQVQVSKDEKGAWILGTEKAQIDPGKVEQVSTELVSMRASSTLPADFARDAVGLTNPTRTVIVRNGAGKQVVFRIGSLNPTGDGYYVQVDDQAPVVVAQASVDGVVNPLISLVATPTAAPAATNPQQTATP